MGHRAQFGGVRGLSNGHLKFYLRFLFYIAKFTIPYLCIELAVSPTILQNTSSAYLHSVVDGAKL